MDIEKFYETLDEREKQVLYVKLLQNNNRVSWLSIERVLSEYDISKRLARALRLAMAEGFYFIEELHRDELIKLKEIGKKSVTEYDYLCDDAGIVPRVY